MQHMGKGSTRENIVAKGKLRYASNKACNQGCTLFYNFFNEWFDLNMNKKSTC